MHDEKILADARPRVPIEPGPLFNYQPVVAIEVVHCEDGATVMVYAHLPDGTVLTISLCPGEVAFAQVHSLGLPPNVRIH